MYVDQRRGGEDGHVCGAEEGLEVVCCEGGAEEDEEDGEGRCCEEGGQG